MGSCKIIALDDVLHSLDYKKNYTNSCSRISGVLVKNPVLGLMLMEAVRALAAAG